MDGGKKTPTLCLFSRCHRLQSRVSWRFYYVFPPRGLCLICTFPLSNKTVLKKTVLKTERKKGQQKHPVAVKGFQPSYVRNARAGAFCRGKMQSFALVVPAPGPAETQGDQKLLPRGQDTAESYKRRLPLQEQLFCWAQNHLLPTPRVRCNAWCFITQQKSGEKKHKPTTKSNPQTPYLSNLTAPTTLLVFPTQRMCPSGWEPLF